MNEYSLTPEEQRDIEALQGELAKQVQRTQVNLEGVGSRLRASRPPVERRISDDRREIALSFDLSAIVETLQQLPDAAGTDAFVAAYNVRP